MESMRKGDLGQEKGEVIILVQLNYRLLHGTCAQKMMALTCSEGGFWGPPKSKGDQNDTPTPVGG